VLQFVHTFTRKKKCKKLIIIRYCQILVTYGNIILYGRNLPLCILQDYLFSIFQTIIISTNNNTEQKYYIIIIYIIFSVDEQFSVTVVGVIWVSSLRALFIPFAGVYREYFEI